MKEYVENVYLRILSIISLLVEMDEGITVNELADRHGVTSDIILEDLRNIMECDELGLNIFLLDEDEGDEPEEFKKQLFMGEYNDCYLAGILKNEQEGYSVQLSAFEKWLLELSMDENDKKQSRHMQESIQVKKVFGKTSSQILGILSQISKAIEEKQKIEIRYLIKQGEKVDYQIIPFKMVQFVDQEIYYLLAVYQEKIYFYRVDKIIQVMNAKKYTNIDQNIERKMNEAIEEFSKRWGMGKGDDEAFEFEMIVYDEAFLPQRLQKELIHRQYGKWQKNKDGSFTYVDKVIGYDNLKSWVMSLGSSVKVIKPKQLAEDIVKSAELRMQFYEPLLEKE